ncbi:TetR/AcrR family transcriptional regulator [Nocardioides jejuensis]|uniref:TetR family transcriptional regulator n=1 Tax=Nocardioides jejuensis TaxID=2502782 RepID=A0A4R1CDQ7_9ACTN|nr:TetR family transcriptional regulator C-terminal domain-containing protein [Nocardioides jejuensis]TCJ28355.1 TetR family transcriptional regulator [Nocardioides jejuensis]
MPKVVDHDERRRELVAATMRVVERLGLEGVTIREIASEAGYSTGVLAHYFTNKADILVTAHLAAFEQVASRVDALRASPHHPVELMRLALEEALPLDRPRLIEAQIDVSFWGLALRDPYLRSVREDSYVSTIAILRDLIDDIVTEGHALPGTDVDGLARETLALIDGISIQAVLFPSQMTPEVQREAVQHHLRSFTTYPVATA